MRAIVIEPGESRPLIWHFDSVEEIRAAFGGKADIGVYKGYMILSSADPHARPNRMLDGRTLAGPVVITAVGGLGRVEALNLRDECAAWPRAMWGAANEKHIKRERNGQ